MVNNVGINKLTDKINTGMYNAIRSNYKMKLKKGIDNSRHPGSKEKNTAIIKYNKTNYPTAAFTHELLHCAVQIKGYRKIKWGISLNKDTNKHMDRLIAVIDEEFQHHKMYNKFEELGFTAYELYNDKDGDIVPYLQDALNTAGQSFLSMSVDYLTLIAPGGVLSGDQIEDFRQRFFTYEGGKYSANFRAIDDIMANWTLDSGYDAEHYIIQFFQNINAGKTWISYAENTHGLSPENFPGTGYFTGSGFTLEDIIQVYAKKNVV